MRYQDSKIGLNPHGSSIATHQFFSGIIFAKVTKNNVELISCRWRVQIALGSLPNTGAGFLAASRVKRAMDPV